MIVRSSRIWLGCRYTLRRGIRTVSDAEKRKQAESIGVESNSSEKRSVTRLSPQAEPGGAEVAGEWPSPLDNAASPALEGIAQRTLLDVCTDLFGKLEASLVTNRQEFIDSYFTTLVKQDEMATLWTDPVYYEHLRTVIQKDVLPLYDRYCAIREKVLERTEARSFAQVLPLGDRNMPGPRAVHHRRARAAAADASADRGGRRASRLCAVLPRQFP